MRVGVLINEFTSLVPSQSTAMMIRELAAQGHTAFVFGVRDVGTSTTGEAVARTRSWRGDASTESCVSALRAAESHTFALAELDVVLIRTNPARDSHEWAHDGALQLMGRLTRSGVQVVNDPAGLRETGSKLFLGEIPAWTRPATLVTTHRDELVSFVREANGPSVLKPVRGTRGADVFKVEATSTNLNVILDVLLRQGFVMAQSFVPEAVDGDKRVIVLDGEPLEIDGHVAAVHRVPGASEFRSNIHAGGRAIPTTISDKTREVIAAVGPMLVERGIRLAGLDFLGDLICEINVFATGGFQDAERFTGQPFLSHAVRRLLEPV